MLGVALDFENYPSTQTPINGTNLNNMQKLLVDLIYPVGTYYETSEIDFDPNTAWGGTWVLETDGTVLVSKSSTTGSKFNATIGTIVGEETHTLTVNELAAHKHSMYTFNAGGDGTIATGGGIIQDAAAPYKTYYATFAMENTGGGSAHNNVQPSKIANRWHRTA